MRLTQLGHVSVAVRLAKTDGEAADILVEEFERGEAIDGDVHAQADGGG